MPVTKMNPEVKAAWVAALRSGDYRQGKRKLFQYREGEKVHCCLGVLCDLYDKANGFELKPSERGSNYPETTVVAWAGLDHFNPRVSHAWGETGIANLNDGSYVTYIGKSSPPPREHTFEEIANIIEEQL